MQTGPGDATVGAECIKGVGGLSSLIRRLALNEEISGQVIGSIMKENEKEACIG